MTIQRMVEEQIESRGVRDERVLEALLRVPREVFVPDVWRAQALDDRALPIGNGQTISQPYIVARMTELLGVQPMDTVLEVGTGSGYQTAVLAELARHVYTLEVLPDLGRLAKSRLDGMGYENISVRIGDGHAGWGEAAPFNRAIGTAAPGRVPQALVEQLGSGGRLVVPIGVGDQMLVVVDKGSEGISQREVMPVRFVPMTGTPHRCE